MSILNISQYTHRPNLTELGMASTHETYLLVASQFDLSGIFPHSIEVNVKDTHSEKTYELKSAIGNEFRINQMGKLYRDYDVRPGDEIIITKIEKEDNYDVFITVNKFNRVVLTTTKNGTEISNIERIKGLKKDYGIVELDATNGEKNIHLSFQFKGSEKKRKDSPSPTDFYIVKQNGENIPNGAYFLNINDNSALQELPKCEFAKVSVDESLLNIHSNIKLSMKVNKYQQIYYGAPGTGKSFDIDRITKTYSTIRTTFHPDSDYSTFVGAYKPTMTKSKVYGAQGPVLDKGKEVEENRITYTFIKQAFLKAYLGAWKKYADGGDEVQPQFLVIEEINRGNCAQIFGDLFQLLDRGSNGFSTYPIEADADLQKEIENAFSEEDEYKIEGDLDVAGAVKGYTSNYGKSLSEDIKSGRVLLLPNNLYIWATMNTSDQSSFPIDSAFKRRWDWKYVRITNGYERDEEGHFKLDDQGQRVPLNWQIKVDADTKFDWWDFIQAINEKIADATSSDDKKLGYFFCKPQGDSKTIDAETFVGKVIFYLWNDVFKDEDADIFKLGAKSPTFDQFYTEDAKTGDIKADTEVVRLFLVDKLQLKPLENNENESDEEEDEDGNVPSSTTRNYDKFSINGNGRYGKNRLAAECVKEYIRLNPDMSAEDVLSNWKSLGMIVSYFVESQEEHEARTDKCKDRVEAIPCGSETIYVAIDGYGSNGKADVLMNAVNQKDWGIRIAKLD